MADGQFCGGGSKDGLQGTSYRINIASFEAIDRLLIIADCETHLQTLSPPILLYKKGNNDRYRHLSGTASMGRAKDVHLADPLESVP